MDNSVAVIIPAYNASTTIVAAVESALAAGASEVVVCDDGSTDDTAKLAGKAGARVVKQANSGASEARRNGAKHADSAHMIFLDADDRLLGSGVQESLAVFRDHPGAAVVAGRVIGVNAKGGQVAYPRGFIDYRAASLVRSGYSPWPPAAQVISRKYYLAQDQLGLPYLHTRYAEDYEMMIRLAMVGTILTHEMPSCLYSLEGGKSARNASLVVECKERIRSYYGSYLDVRWRPLSRLQRISASAARTGHASLSQRKYLNALAMFALAVSSNPRIIGSALARRLRWRSIATIGRGGL